MDGTANLPMSCLKFPLPVNHPQLGLAPDKVPGSHRGADTQPPGTANHRLGNMLRAVGRFLSHGQHTVFVNVSVPQGHL